MILREGGNTVWSTSETATFSRFFGRKSLIKQDAPVPAPLYYICGLRRQRSAGNINTLRGPIASEDLVERLLARRGNQW